MRAKPLIICCLAAALLIITTPAFASEEPGPLAVAADVVVARPACFVATILGSALFVVALPIAAISHSIHRTAHALVVTPARATFIRPLGDLGEMKDY